MHAYTVGEVREEWQGIKVEFAWTIIPECDAKNFWPWPDKTYLVLNFQYL